MLYIGWLGSSLISHAIGEAYRQQFIGAILIGLTVCISWLAIREHKLATPVVKIQQERGHKVVTTRSYSFVRHPIYAGAISFLIGRLSYLARFGASCSHPC
jgi:protein-S-isoprenylcysteine O-methyltransferase Ste14